MMDRHRFGETRAAKKWKSIFAAKRQQTSAGKEKLWKYNCELLELVFFTATLFCLFRGCSVTSCAVWKGETLVLTCCTTTILSFLFFFCEQMYNRLFIKHTTSHVCWFLFSLSLSHIYILVYYYATLYNLSLSLHKREWLSLVEQLNTCN